MRQQEGFSLVSVLVAVAVAGILALVVAQMLGNQARVQAKQPSGWSNWVADCCGPRPKNRPSGNPSNFVQGVGPYSGQVGGASNGFVYALCFPVKREKSD